MGSIKNVAIFFAVCAAIVAASVWVAAANAAQTGMTCKYRITGGIAIALTGSDVSSSLCNQLDTSSHPRTYYATGRSFCAWESQDMDVRVAVLASNSSKGRYACSYIRKSGLLDSSFTRIY